MGRPTREALPRDIRLAGGRARGSLGAPGCAMSRSKPKQRPSTPDEILARRVEAARVRTAGPAAWGLAPGLEKLKTSKGHLDVTRDHAGNVAAAKRMDAFDSLFHARGLSEHQHHAAQILIHDWATMLGVAGEPEVISDRIDADFDPVKADPIGLRMIAAQERVANALAWVGPENAQLLRALVEPIVLKGAHTGWRDLVERVTGETERNCQGSIVRRACENLRLCYGVGPPAPRLHPFHFVEPRDEPAEAPTAPAAAPALRRRPPVEELVIYVDEHGLPDPVISNLGRGCEVEVVRLRRR